MGQNKIARYTGDLARKVTGISTPLIGIQWSAGPSERNEVRCLLISLEDKRVLFNPSYLEVHSEVVSSLHSIRDECTKTLKNLDEKAWAIHAISLIRAACRRFHDDETQTFKNFCFQGSPVPQLVSLLHWVLLGRPFAIKWQS